MESFTHDGLVFDVRDAGPADGDIVVLLHGWPQDSTAWRQVSPLLHEAGLRTLAPDLRGYSPGARPAGRAAYRMPRLIGDVVALLDAAGVERAHVVGHDWGGVLAWTLTERVPERVATLTVMSTPHPAAMAWAVRHSGQALKGWYMLAFQLPWLPEAVLRRKLPDLLRSAQLPEADVQRYVDRFGEEGGARGALNWYRGAAPRMRPLKAARKVLRRAPTGRSGEPGRPRSITVATTYVWGRRDPVLGRAAAERTARHVTGDYRFVEVDAGHWLPETRAGKCAAEIVRRVTGAG